MGGSGGRLVLVATPIGNLDDLSPRAVRTLADADVVCCEDTRRTGRLLQAAGVEGARLVAVHDHNEASRSREILALLDAGQVVAVVTDAGTPGISDPGERLVRAAAAAGHDVEVVPGPAAVVAALVVSGLPTGRFVFEGFLPRRGAARDERLAALAHEPRTIVLYEAPHRLARTLADLAAALGPERAVSISREITKLHEETWRGTLDGAAAQAAASPPRGEHVVVVAGAPPPGPATDDDLRRALASSRAAGRSTRDAVAEVAAAYDVPKRRVYAIATAGTDPAGRESG